MKHLTPLVIKYFLIAFVLALILPLFGSYVVTVSFFTAVPITIILYSLGDLTVLPRRGNTAATMFSTLLAGLIIWGSIYLLPGLTISWSGIVFSSLTIGISDWFYHRWLIRNGIIQLFPYDPI